MPFYGVYDFINRHGTGRADMEGFLAKRVFKSPLADDRARWEQASPISHVGPHAPPFFVLHGTNDSLVPVEQARTFVDELRKESNQPVVYAELPGAQHAFEMFPSVRTHATVHAVERFLAVVRSEHGGADAGRGGRRHHDLGRSPQAEVVDSSALTHVRSGSARKLRCRRRSRIVRADEDARLRVEIVDHERQAREQPSGSSYARRARRRAVVGEQLDLHPFACWMNWG